MSAAATQRPSRPRGLASGGFTLLELLISVAIFSILGGTAVFMMRQGAQMFSVGARDSELADRQDTLLPEVLADLQRIALPDSLDPPIVPSEEMLEPGMPKPAPPPPVGVRLRAGTVLLRDQADPGLKGYPCPYVAFVVHTGDEANDPRLRTAGDPVRAGETAKPYTKPELERATAGTVFKATGGLMTVCWLAVPLDAARPSVLTLFRGFQSPVGGPDSLLEPASFDTLAEVRARFEKKHEGVLHFAVTWRRAGVRDWEAGTDRGGGEDVPYVGPVWDSTRALDKSWPLFRDPASLGDPSDDLFPQYARLEATLIPPVLGGYKRGDTRLSDTVPAEATRLPVESLEPLLGRASGPRFLKVGTEWMRYDATRIDPVGLTVTVERGERGTGKQSHDVGADVWVGQAATTVMALPAWRDRTFRAGGGR
ncbi:MAG: type II secretion system protein [Planctomycetia bacterium]